MTQRKIKISCWRRDCSALATPVNQGNKKRGVNREICFQCEKGHKFHTDATMTRSSPCDCPFGSHDHHRPGWNARLCWKGG